jgi:hypothetical protein
MVFHNVNYYVCDCAEETMSTWLLRAYRAAGLRVNVLKNDIEMDIIETALMTTGLNLIWLTYNLKISIISHDIW